MKDNTSIHQPTSIVNYALNKFCPMLIIAFLVFSSFGFKQWEPYAVTILSVFSQYFHYKVGYAVAIC